MREHAGMEVKSTSFKNDSKSPSYVYSNLNINLLASRQTFTYKRLPHKIIRKYLYIYIHSFKRSTRLSVINSDGLVLLTLSVGMLDFKKSQRKGPFAAARLFRSFSKKFNKLHLGNKVVICLKGNGPGRRPLINFLGKGRFRKSCVSLIDLTRLPFNGCRLKKKRRL